MDEIVVARFSHGVVTLTLNRPQRKNAINGTMWTPVRWRDAM